jgi:hypothetical protein
MTGTFKHNILQVMTIVKKLVIFLLKEKVVIDTRARMNNLS